MLGMMMDFLRDSIDPVFAKGMLTIYNSTTSVIMGIAQSWQSLSSFRRIRIRRMIRRKRSL